MKREVTGNREFLDQILSAAREEADKLITEAESRAEARRMAARRQAETIEGETGKQLEGERSRRVKLADQRISSEKRRRELQLKDSFMADALEKTREELLAMTASDSYSVILAGWVKEAVLGLGADKVELNGRPREREIMTPSWLRLREEEIKDTYGRQVSLELSPESALIPAGVVARQKEGRLVFNNQIDTRILRKQSELRKVIYQELFAK